MKRFARYHINIPISRYRHCRHYREHEIGETPWNLWILCDNKLVQSSYKEQTKTNGTEQYNNTIVSIAQRIIWKQWQIVYDNLFSHP